MQNLYLPITIRRLAGITLLSLACATAQAGTPGRGYGTKPSKPTPAPAQQYQAQSSCPTAGCVEFFRGFRRAGKP